MDPPSEPPLSVPATEAAPTAPKMAAATVAPLAPSQETAYRKKCIQLKRRLQEIEVNNDATRRRIERERQHIQKMRLNRAILLNHLRLIMEAPNKKWSAEQLAEIGVLANGAGHAADFVADAAAAPRLRDGQTLLDDDSSGESEEEAEPAERPERRRRNNPTTTTATASASATNTNNPPHAESAAAAAAAAAAATPAAPQAPAVQPASSTPAPAAAASSSSVYPASGQPALADIAPAAASSPTAGRSTSTYSSFHLGPGAYPGAAANEPKSPTHLQHAQHQSPVVAAAAVPASSGAPIAAGSPQQHTDYGQEPSYSQSNSFSQMSPAPNNGGLAEPPVRPEPPFQQFTDHMRPQLEADNYDPAQIDARIQSEWVGLSAENRRLWDVRYGEQMAEFTRLMDEYKRQQRQQGASFSESRNRTLSGGS